MAVVPQKASRTRALPTAVEVVVDRFPTSRSLDVEVTRPPQNLHPGKNPKQAVERKGREHGGRGRAAAAAPAAEAVLPVAVALPAEAVPPGEVGV